LWHFEAFFSPYSINTISPHIDAFHVEDVCYLTVAVARVLGRDCDHSISKRFLLGIDFGLVSINGSHLADRTAGPTFRDVKLSYNQLNGLTSPRRA
jgi:hypothetical protein